MTDVPISTMHIYDLKINIRHILLFEWASAAPLQTCAVKRISIYRITRLSCLFYFNFTKSSSAFKYQWVGLLLAYHLWRRSCQPNILNWTFRSNETAATNGKLLSFSLTYTTSCGGDGWGLTSLFLHGCKRAQHIECIWKTALIRSECDKQWRFHFI